MKKMLFATALLLVVNVETRANTIYTYVGNNYFDIETNLPSGISGYDTSTRVTSSIEVENLEDLHPGNLLNFSFSDGRNVIDSNSATLTQFHFGVDGTGNIVNWFLTVIAGDPSHTVGGSSRIDSSSPGSDEVVIETCDCAPGGSTIDLAVARSGVWTLQSTAPVPLPGTLGLLSMGVLGLTNLRRKLLRAD